VVPRRGFVVPRAGFVCRARAGHGGWCYELIMRLFVAVAVPAHAADELDDAVAPLRRSASARLMPRLERAAARHPCLPVSLDGAGAFPGAARARVLWTGVQGDLRASAALAASVAAGARRAGAPPAEEGRRFQPHLTLARCREPVDARSLVAGLSGYAGTPWTAEEIYLIRSHLPGGRPHDRPRYETLGSWPLRAA
jgi:2'-5' RNA ligase